MWKTKNAPINSLYQALLKDNPDLDKKDFLSELKDMNTYLYICEYGVNTCDLDSLMHVYLKEKKSGLRGFAEGIYDTYPEYFNNQLRLMNEETLKEKALKEKKSKKKGC